MFPGLKLKNGEYLYLINNYTAFTANDTVCLPGSTAIYTVDTTASDTTFAKGKFNYTWTKTGGTIAPTPLDSYVAGLAILEEKQVEASNAQDVVYFAVSEVGTTSRKLAATTPATTFTDTSAVTSFVTLGSN